jgi:hypothetical protein
MVKFQKNKKIQLMQFAFAMEGQFDPKWFNAIF